LKNLFLNKKLVCSRILFIGKDQFAYKTGSNTTTAFIKCQHQWLKWLDDEEVDSVRVISFDFSKVFDTVPHDILCEKLKQTNLYPYVINWILDLLTNRKQRVVVDGIVTDFLDINRGVPQGTVIGPLLFSLILVNDINLEDHESNLLIKFADDLTVSAPVKTTGDSAASEVSNSIIG
jgi:retron-type reverse transcriptase